MSGDTYDIFVNHADADKQPFVTALVRMLQKADLRVWYDEDILKGGDSLTKVIGDGMLQSRHALVILSKAFIDSNPGWRDHEYRALLAKQINEKQLNLIIPVLYGVSHQEVAAYDPMLADRFQLDFGKLGYPGLLLGILRVVKPERVTAPEDTVKFFKND